MEQKNIKKGDKISREILFYWMKTFGERNQAINKAKGK